MQSVFHGTVQNSIRAYCVICAKKCVIEFLTQNLTVQHRIACRSFMSCRTVPYHSAPYRAQRHRISLTPHRTTPHQTAPYRADRTYTFEPHFTVHNTIHHESEPHHILHVVPCHSVPLRASPCRSVACSLMPYKSTWHRIISFRTWYRIQTLHATFAQPRHSPPRDRKVHRNVSSLGASVFFKWSACPNVHVLQSRLKPRVTFSGLSQDSCMCEMLEIKRLSFRKVFLCCAPCVCE